MLLLPDEHAPFRLVLADPAWPYADRRETRRDNPDRKPKFGTGVERRYSAGTMKLEDILEIGEYLKPLLAKDAYLFLWATAPNLPMAIKTLEAWGFRYVTIPFTWIKVYPNSGDFFKGTGRYTQSNEEPCLMGAPLDAEWGEIERVLLGVRGKQPPWHPSTGWRPSQIQVAEDITFMAPCGDMFVEPHPRHDVTNEKGRIESKIIHSRKPPKIREALTQWFGNVAKLELFATERPPGWTAMGHALSGLDIREELRRFEVGEEIPDTSTEPKETKPFVISQDTLDEAAYWRERNAKQEENEERLRALFPNEEDLIRVQKTWRYRAPEVAQAMLDTGRMDDKEIVVYEILHGVKLDTKRRDWLAQTNAYPLIL